MSMKSSKNNTITPNDLIGKSLEDVIGMLEEHSYIWRISRLYTFKRTDPPTKNQNRFNLDVEKGIVVSVTLG